MNSVIRMITASSPLMGNSNLTSKFLTGDTKRDLAEAKRNYQKWHEAQKWSIDDENAAFDAISDYLYATERYYHEQGMCCGIQLMCEAMTGYAMREALYEQDT